MRPDVFHQKIRKALANPALQAALDYNSAKRKDASGEAFASLPDPDTHRQKARGIREQVVANLEQYLEQFVCNVQANGIVVHRAADGAEAVQIVLEIARQHSAKLIAKAKTMVSEEIELNHAVEAAGIKVVETDLGEFIVQLRGERPGHILTPAVHLRRGEVAQTFVEKLGIAYTEDVEELTQVARRTLRQVFLNADIGISGVNFGVVETGTLCVLTNEGNGRMCTTVPPVHVALMGIERMLPTMDDLAALLRVLPRASTGQKLTVYTSLLHGPRRAEDPDGPGERHLVLVDNGRRRLGQGPLSEALLCVRCGACLNACPIFREIGGHAYVGAHGQASVYSGPIGSVISPVFFGSQEFANLARASTLCGACREACPVGIDLPGMLLKVRAGQAETALPGKPARVPAVLAWILRIYSRVAAAGGSFRLAQWLMGLGGALVGRKGWIRLPAFTGWGYAKDFPQPARRTFTQRFKARQPKELPSQQEIATLAAARPESSDEERSLAMTAQSGEVGAPDLLERMEQEVTELGGVFVRCQADTLAEKIAERIQLLGGGKVWTWEAAGFPPGLLEALQSRGVELTQAGDASIMIGLTGALAAAAETGSLALPGGPGQPLLASLLPENHLAVLRRSQIHLTLEEVLRLPELRQAAAAALVSGPSRTGDIELTLTVGVHGPKRIVIFCVEDL